MLLCVVDACDATLPALCDDSEPSFSFNAPSFYPGTTPEFLAVLKANLISEAPKAVEMVATVASKPLRDAKGRFIPRNVVNAIDSMQAQVIANGNAMWTAPINDRPCTVPSAPMAQA